MEKTKLPFTFYKLLLQDSNEEGIRPLQSNPINLPQVDKEVVS